MIIETQFYPGALGEIITLHAQYYAENWGFGTFFEAKVGRELSDFATRCATNDLLLLARDDTGLAASLILDLNDSASGVRGGHLRWFIAAERCRGSGMGRALMETAITHAERHSGGRMWLTTFKGLGPARHLYESFGFHLAAEAPGEAWGTVVTEQEFQRKVP
ncbi:MAG: GNAT family N-acetyltransferase [Silicimonas sp.]|nr:GNAT family N-acetyltransferase [Silicimonas sp.]